MIDSHGNLFKVLGAQLNSPEDTTSLPLHSSYIFWWKHHSLRNSVLFLTTAYFDVLLQHSFHTDALNLNVLHSYFLQNISLIFKQKCSYCKII